jgi:Tfp pilus assembly protein PilZ
MLRNWIRRTEPTSDRRTTGRRGVSGDETSSGWDRSKNSERANPRYEARLFASLDIDGAAYAGFTENLSESGVFVSSHALPPVGAEVSLLIALPDLALIRAQGTVRWLRAGSALEGRTSGMGIRFDQLSPLDAVRLHEFVRARHSKKLDSEGSSLRSA